MMPPKRGLATEHEDPWARRFSEELFTQQSGNPNALKIPCAAGKTQHSQINQSIKYFKK